MKIISRQCRICKKVKHIGMSDEGYEMWMMGASIRDAEPNMSIEDQEFILSNICDPCYDSLFPEENKDGDKEC